MMDLPSYSFLVLFLILTTFGRDLQSEAQNSDANLRKLATANNYLAVNMYQQIVTGSEENIFFSPLSLSTAFGLLYYGTRGDTAKELRNGLGYDRAGLQGSSVHQTFRTYLNQTLPSLDSTAYTLNSANAIYFEKELDLIPDYKTKVQDFYQASVKCVDFTHEGPEIARQINDWVSEKTNGKINKLADTFDPFTLMVLLNAVYFKGTWKKQFDPSDTSPRNFYNNGLDSGKKKTTTMIMNKRFKFAQTDEAKVLEMPYVGNNISMVVLLPHQRDGLDSLERSLNLSTFTTFRRKLVKKQVLVSIPKFKIDFFRELTKDFESLGIRHVFNTTANFSGITTALGVALNQVIHRAFVEVNEGGTEAAGVTGAFAMRSVPNFIADHPFLFAIIDRRNNMILFMGRVTNL